MGRKSERVMGIGDCEHASGVDHIGSFKGFDGDDLKRYFSCCFTFANDEGLSCLRKRYLSRLNFKNWLIQDYCLHLTVVLTIEKESGFALVYERDADFCQSLRNILKEYASHTLTFNELRWGKAGDLTLFGPLGFVSETESIIESLIQKSAPGLRVVRKYDFIHTVLARNWSRDRGQMRRFYDYCFLEMEKRISQEPIELRISDEPYVGVVSSLLIK